MEIERWQRIEQVYNSVFEAPPDQRAALLDEACSGDEDLRQEVESLLSASDEANAFLSEADRKGHVRALTRQPPESVVGSTLGSYHVLSFLGAGSMGEVYLARDSKLDRQVALKLLPYQYTQDPERVARFVREAKAASSLNHPNIVTIHEIGQAGDAWFITAEYIPGGTLRDRMASGILPLSETVDIVLQCAGALAVAHRAGVVHRDVKPENLMVRPDGIVKVVDFGLARIVEDRRERNLEASQIGSVIGTPRYMSPEQARGQKPDPRSDIFSLGAVLFEMVTGRPAFPGATTPEIFAALLGSEPDVSGAGALGGVMAKALAKDPAARHLTMDELASDLRTIDLTQPLPKGQRSRFAPVPWRTAAVALSLVAVAGLAGYTWIARDRPQDGPLQLVPLATFGGQKAYGVLSPDGDRIAFSWRPPGSSNWDIHVKPVGEGEPVQVTSSPYDESLPAWSPDGKSIAFARLPHGDGDVPHEIHVVPADGGEARKIAVAWRGHSWSPDGKTIALARVPNDATSPGGASGGIFLLSLESGESRDLTVSGRDSFPLFSPNGQWIAFKRQAGGASMEILVISAAGGPPKRLTSQPYAIRAPTWTADSREIVFASQWSGADGSLWRVPIAGGPPRPVSATLRDASDPSISARRRRLAYREEWSDSNLYLLTARDIGGDGPAGFGEPVSVVSASRADESPAIAPDGERIAFVSNRSGHLEIWVARRDGSQAVPLTALRAQNTGTPRWSPDGRRIAFDSWASGRSAIYVVDAAGGAPRPLIEGPLASWMTAWSPDGKWMYFSRGRESPEDIWKIPAAGGDAIQLTHSGGFESHPSPDGRLIYYSRQVPGAGRAIWSIPAAGGAEQPVPELEGFRSIGRSWGVIDQGIYFVSYEDSPQQTVRFLSFRTRQVTPLFPLQKQIDWRTGALSLSRDGRYAVATQLDHAVNNLMMIDNFR